jgi:hypothetical protein
MASTKATTSGTSPTNANNNLHSNNSSFEVAHLEASSPVAYTSSSSSSSSRPRQSEDTDTILISSPLSDSFCHKTIPYRQSGMSSPARHSSYYHPSDSNSALPTSTYNSQNTRTEGRPLIDLVTNEWASKSYRDSSFESSDSYSNFMSDKEGLSGLPNWIRNISVPRRVQRYLFAYAIFLIACWFGWLYYLQPAWAQERLYDASLAALNENNQAFGMNIRPEFTDMIHLKNLDTELLPGSKKEDRRLVFVGDVHGCKDERRLDWSTFDSFILTFGSTKTPGKSELRQGQGSSHSGGRHDSQRP